LYSALKAGNQTTPLPGAKKGFCSLNKGKEREKKKVEGAPRVKGVFGKKVGRNLW